VWLSSLLLVESSEIQLAKRFELNEVKLRLSHFWQLFSQK
jgi:hypothetical protein